MRLRPTLRAWKPGGILQVVQFSGVQTIRCLRCGRFWCMPLKRMDAEKRRATLDEVTDHETECLGKDPPTA